MASVNRAKNRAANKAARKIVIRFKARETTETRGTAETLVGTAASLRAEKDALDRARLSDIRNHLRNQYLRDKEHLHYRKQAFAEAEAGLKIAHKVHLKQVEDAEKIAPSYVVKKLQEKVDGLTTSFHETSAIYVGAVERDSEKEADTMWDCVQTISNQLAAANRALANAQEKTADLRTMSDADKAQAIRDEKDMRVAIEKADRFLEAAKDVRRDAYAALCDAQNNFYALKLKMRTYGVRYD